MNSHVSSSTLALRTIGTFRSLSLWTAQNVHLVVDTCMEVHAECLPIQITGQSPKRGGNWLLADVDLSLDPSRRHDSKLL